MNKGDDNAGSGVLESPQTDEAKGVMGWLCRLGDTTVRPYMKGIIVHASCVVRDQALRMKDLLRIVESADLHESETRCFQSLWKNTVRGVRVNSYKLEVGLPSETPEVSYRLKPLL